MRTRGARVLWIDDDPDRRQMASQVAQTVGLLDSVHPLELEEQTDNFKKLGDLLRKRRYDLILMDYDLAGQRAPTPVLGATKFDGRAPRMLGILHDRGASNVPIYVVSGHFKDATRSWKYVDLGRFDAVLGDEELDEPAFAQRLRADALEYRRCLNACRKQSVDQELAKKLASVPPEAEGPFLEAAAWLVRAGASTQAVPGSLWEAGQSYATLMLRGGASTLEFLRWLRLCFLRVPGPLLDERRAAISVGMTPEAFRKRANDFRAARYRGAFGGTLGSYSLWWRNSLEAIVYARAGRVGASESNIPSLAVKAFAIGKKEVQYCSVAKKRGEKVVAETLAYPPDVEITEDGAEEAAEPVARRNASIDTSADLPPPFDRVFRLPSEAAD